jgi:hypothetical protein
MIRFIIETFSVGILLIPTFITIHKLYKYNK